ncbi:hypothetical protein B4U80_09299, partial [Leptotrombidium deliense]
MSLGGGSNTFVDDTVNLAYDNGKVVVVAAGNYAADSCLFSPARAPKAYTVAASDIMNKFAVFSNYGTCTDIIAPGVDCELAKAGTNQYITLSGTSMATPLVAGWAAIIEGKKRFNNPQKLIDYMDW